MKRIIGIYCGSLSDSQWDENTVLQYGAGGSETWCVEMAREFQTRGFHVIVFGQPSSWHFAPSGVEYVPYELFDDRCEYQRFDYFISSRMIVELTTKLSCPNVYIMSHDICMHYTNDYKDLKLDRVKKIAFLSDYHKWALESWYQGSIPDEQLFLTSNGVNIEPYLNGNIIKKNKMVWSSRQERGLEFFLESIFPLIKQAIPDFEVDICLYESDFSQEIDGVHFIGKVGKEELCRRQMESKIWIYPNLGYLTQGNPFQETFCISAVENGMAHNAIITSVNGGLSTTLHGYSGLIEGDFITDNYIYGEKNITEYAKIVVEEAIKLLSDDNYRKQKADECFDICKKYTWANAVDGWLKEWKIKYGNYILVG